MRNELVRRSVSCSLTGGLRSARDFAPAPLDDIEHLFAHQFLDLFIGDVFADSELATPVGAVHAGLKVPFNGSHVVLVNQWLLKNAVL